MSDLRALMKRERMLQQKVATVAKFVEAFDRDRDECQIEVRLKNLDEVYSDFFLLREKIELLVEDAKSTDEDGSDSKKDEKEKKDAISREQENLRVVEEFENRYCMVKGSLLKLLPAKVSVQRVDGNSGGQSAQHSKVKLPEISLPTFSGKLGDWVMFRDTFRSLIHQNGELNPMDKFTYLRTSLKGDALMEINTIELSAVNYEVAWQVLQERYENKKLIVKAYLDALFSMEPLRRESYDGLNQLVSEFEKNLQMLEKIGEQTAQWSTILAYMLCGRLDTATLRLWEAHHNSKDVPKGFFYLCTNTANSHSTRPPQPQPSTSQASTSHTYIALPKTPTQNILLSTALIRVKDRFGNVMLARALLDSCSQHCLMTKEFSNKLKFRVSPTYLSVHGIGSGQCVSTKLVSAGVSPSFNPSEWKLPRTALLADPNFYEAGPVDVIIGAEHYLDLLAHGQLKVMDDGPTLQNTVFGWIVSGRVPDSSITIPRSLVHVCSSAELQDQLTKFWEVETCRTTSTHSVEESTCEEIFATTTVRDDSGRFVVTLPKKDYLIEKLGESRSTAVRRLCSLQRRLSLSPELRTQYSEFIQEYLDMGHMVEILDERCEGTTYYLPHHAVLKPESTTTKLRVVFDASCKTSTGVSLNDALMVGPVVQDELININLRFRLHRYAVVADVAKMYRMVAVSGPDQKLQRIVWTGNTDQDIRTFQLTTVTYGTASAPYLATRCLKQLAEEGKETHPTAAAVLKQNFYVDDMLSGVDDIEEGKQFVEEMVDLMQSGGFTLRKWNSNCGEILRQVPEHLRDDRSILTLDSADSTVKTLGLQWEPRRDVYRFSTPKWTESGAITKRIILSDISRLFDPLGIIGPVIVQAKLIVQELWERECSWDAPLSEDMTEKWLEYRRNMIGLDGFTVPRWVGVTKSMKSVQLHGFCDASKKAYGACIYVRTVTEDDEVDVRLFTAKSRVAPLENLKKKKKCLSTPRLELSSALLLAHLYEKVVESIHLTAESHFGLILR
ncbi:uncharacterized protein LOC134203611 [Armigeres subalbatus]|uniref:uncharacterized protein LOC134203611 n=1 Tax=Armigeres subalbatus TaxID=124917 RepID=UPI002ED07D3B